MLETVREFGLEQLAASGEEAAIQQAHAAWCLALAETEESWTWGGSRQRWWLDRLEVNLPNLRAALDWLAEIGDAETGARLAMALWGYWHLRSHRAEGRARLERALAHDGSSDRTRAKALFVLGQLYHLTGTQRETDLLEESLALSRRLADERSAATALFLLGVAARNRGDLAHAASLLGEAGELAAKISDKQIVTLVRQQLGVIALDQSGPEGAEPLLEEALALHQRQGDTFGVACTLLVLGWAAAKKGDLATAVARYADSLALWEELGTQEGVVDVLAAVAELAEVAGVVGCREQAVRLLALAEALGATLGYVMPPPERVRYEQANAALRVTLGEARFSEAWAAGLTIPPECGVAEARAALAALLAVLPASTPPPAAAADGLTPRERDVLRLVVAGRSNPEIAEALFLSRRTVTTHLTRIFAKLGVQGRAEAAVYAVRHGLV
jgi:non-specific serine/threonine protein kinase